VLQNSKTHHPVRRTRGPVGGNGRPQRTALADAAGCSVKVTRFERVLKLEISRRATAGVGPEANGSKGLELITSANGL
jgi:hypothetical protein